MRIFQSMRILSITGKIKVSVGSSSGTSFRLMPCAVSWLSYRRFIIILFLRAFACNLSFSFRSKSRLRNNVQNGTNLIVSLAHGFSSNRLSRHAAIISGRFRSHHCISSSLRFDHYAFSRHGYFRELVELLPFEIFLPVAFFLSPSHSFFVLPPFEFHLLFDLR